MLVVRSDCPSGIELEEAFSFLTELFLQSQVLPGSQQNFAKSTSKRLSSVPTFKGPGEEVRRDGEAADPLHAESRRRRNPVEQQRVLHTSTHSIYI